MDFCTHTKVETIVRVKSKLKDLMQSRGISRMDVVRGAGLSYPTVTRWEENNVKRFDPNTVAKLKNFFQCDESDIYETIEDGE